MKVLKEKSDLDLITLYQESKDAAYFTELYNRFFPLVFQSATTQMGEKESAFEYTIKYFADLVTRINTIQDPKYILSLISKNNISKAMEEPIAKCK